MFHYKLQNTFQNCLIFLYYFVFYLSKDAKTSAKSDEPTAMPSADNVSTTVLGTRPVVALPDLQVNQQLNLAYLLFILLFIIYFY